MSFPFTDDEPFDPERARLAILGALQVAIDRRVELVDIVYEAADLTEAKARVREAFGFDELLVDMVLEFQFRRLNRADRERLTSEYEELRLALESQD